MLCFCEDANEPLCSIKRDGLLAKLRKYQLLQRDYFLAVSRSASYISRYAVNPEPLFTPQYVATEQGRYKQPAPSFPLPLNSISDKFHT